MTDDIREALEKPHTEKLSNAKLSAMIPLYVEGKPGADHKCGSCAMRILPHGCTIVQGDIDMENGTCAFWAEGKASQPDDERSYKMPKGAAGYTETSGAKVNCSTCKAYHAGYCNLWQGKVGDGDCCSTWHNSEVEKAV